MRKWLLSVLLVGSAVVGVPASAAAAPANDAFAAAIPLTIGTDVSSSNVDATVETGEPNPTNSSQANTCPALSEDSDCGTSVWYTFGPVAPGEYTIDSCDGGTDFPSVIGVYTGTTLGALNEVGYSYIGPTCPGVSGGKSQFTFTALAGTLYHVDVTGYTGEQGSFYLRAYSGPAHGRPAPDTEVIRESSLSDAINTLQSTPGVRSGPRHSASFALYSHASGATFECSLDGAGFAPCAATVSYDGLAPGSSHVFSARAVAGGVPDPSPVVQRITLDGTPPDTLISGPSGPFASATATWATAGTKRYNRGLARCSIDDSPTIFCNYVSAKFENLCAGHHTFQTAAVDNATNIDPTPATTSIDVTTGPACAAPTLPKPTDASPTANSVLLLTHFNDMGAGGRLHLEYGPTAAYGMQVHDGYARPKLGEEGSKFSLPYLAPSTLYHFRVTITTPFGTATSPDQTVTTKALEGPAPTVVNGTPLVAGEHAASLPATIDPGETSSSYFVLVEPGAPVTSSSPLVFASETVQGNGGPQAAQVQLVDLEAATTYHYRFSVEQQSGGGQVLGPEGTFTTPPFPKSHFKLKRKLIKVGRLTRKSKSLLIKLHGIPAGTKVKAELKAGKKRARKSGKVKVSKLTLKVRLTRKFRHALLGKGKAKLTVTATPPGDTSSKVSFTVKLQKPRKPRKHH